MQGRAMAPVTRGWTSEGPGPISVRTGGLNEVMLMLVAFINSKYKKGAILPEIDGFNYLFETWLFSGRDRPKVRLLLLSVRQDVRR